jgi:hypothetical protein
MGVPKLDRGIAGVPAVKFVRNVNAQVHAKNRTEGGYRYRKIVAALQGGEFCCLCGETKELHVDHIVPVRQGGDSDTPSNLQILCRRCNTGKGAFLNGLLPQVIQTATGREISSPARYKRLLSNSDKSTGRTFGRCDCQRPVPDVQLHVVVGRRLSAANYVNLKVQCEYCSSKEKGQP